MNSHSHMMFLSEAIGKTIRHSIFIQEGAKHYTSRATGEFLEKHAKGISVCQLSSYTPDCNPIEMLWKKIKQEDIHLHYFPTFESLVRKVEEARFL